MKKLLCVTLILALSALALGGCGRRQAREAEPAADESSGFMPGDTPVPEEGSHGEEDQSAALAELPTLEPVVPIDGAEAAEGQPEDYYSIDSVINPAEEFETYDEASQPQLEKEIEVIDPSTYQYSALIDTSLGFTFNYPTRWQNLPGVYTVCYREIVEPGDFPARVAITAKKLTHTPEGTVLSDELTSYMRMVYKQYEPDSFQVGTPNSEDTFMGKQAYSNTYLAYSGETEVKGFIIGRAVGRVLYVFHFCASYEDYTALEGVMRYMIKSVQLVEDD